MSEKPSYEELREKVQELEQAEIDRNQVEQALKESEEKYRRLVDLSFDGIVIHSQAGIIDINQTGAELLGATSPADILGKSVLNFVYVEDREAVVERMQEVKDKGIGVIIDEERFVRLDGQVLNVEVAGVPVNYQGIPAIQVVFRDITKRKLAEEALRESEEKHRLLFEMESDVIILVRMDDSQIVEVNNAGTKLYGYTRDELLKMKNSDLFAKLDAIQRLSVEGIDHISLGYHRKKDGTVFPVEISENRLSRKGEDTRIITIRDISERIEAEQEKADLEAQLRQKHKMEAIGTLSGGIAHDFNNILGIIIGNAELALVDVPEWNPAHSNLEEIKKAGLRAKDVIRQLLSFSRKAEHERKPVKIAPLIKESIKLIKSSFPSSIEIRQKISAVTDVISGDPFQIHQVMINLCTNAAHAMEEVGGILQISLTNKHLDETEVKQYQGLKAGPHVILTVSDTGYGIEPAIIDRLFDPYFTTKDVDKGTGLGLAVVHGIVKTHEGDISIESVPGEGTVIHVLFPAVEVGKKIIGTRAPGALPGKNERILFVDDEPAIIKMGEQMFERLGYRCESETSPVEALERFQSDPDRFDMIVTDMTMPQVTGEKLAEKILKIRPEMPIILCTGYSDKINEKKSKELGIKAFVMKPIVFQEIAETIRQILDAK